MRHKQVLRRMGDQVLARLADNDVPVGDRVWWNDKFTALLAEMDKEDGAGLDSCVEEFLGLLVDARVLYNAASEADDGEVV